MRCSVGLTTVPQQKQLQSKMPSQAYNNYALGPPHISFHFKKKLSLQPIYYVGVCNSVCLMLSVSHVAALFTNKDSMSWVCTAATLGSISMEGIFSSQWWVNGQQQECTEWLIFPLLYIGEFQADHSPVHQPSSNMVTYSFRAKHRVTQSSIFPMWWGRVFLFRFCPTKGYSQLQIHGTH